MSDGRPTSPRAVKGGNPVPIVLVIVFPLLFRLPPLRIEDEDEHDNEYD
jgi:hypothetical protein